jgi:hypothetical protein
LFDFPDRARTGFIPGHAKKICGTNSIETQTAHLMVFSIFYNLPDRIGRVIIPEKEKSFGD